MNAIKIIFLFVSISVFGQNTNRKFLQFNKKDNRFFIKVNDGTYILKPYNNFIFETSFIPNNETYNPKSHAVVLKPKTIPVKVKETKNEIKIKSKGIWVSIQKKPFQIRYFYKKKFLFAENKGYIKTNKYEILNFSISKNEILFGGGARALGMNRRGYKLKLYNKAHYGYETHSELMNYTMPLFLSSKIYAVHFDNAPIGYLDLDSKQNNTINYETINGRKTYQIIASDSWLDLINQYTNLTGKQPMLPRWALGNFSSRFGYHSQKEVLQTVQKFKRDSIPLDAIIIDIYWFGKDIKGHMGNLEFYKDSFPSPKKMITQLKKQHIKTILVTEPFILTTSKRWKEVSEKGYLATDSIGKPYTYDFYFGNTGLIDIYNTKAKNWFWHIYKKYTKMGIAGWWGDLGEPEVHPANLFHKIGTANQVHNIYGHDWAKLIFEGYHKDFPNQRPFILMRAGYSGSQHYGMIPWSGDVNRSWGGFQSQPEIALQMGMQGLAYMHSDLGGFAGTNPDNQLYYRWLQYGVFQPIFRPHAQEEVPPEPVFKDTYTKQLAKKAIILRYNLLPYNYNLVYENNQKGKPLMRPIFFEEPNNTKLLNTTNYYLWGNDFLIAPIVKANISEKEIYFPKKNNWFDFYTDKKYKGGTSVKVKTHKEYIPTFVRAGSFIPMVKNTNNTEVYNFNKLELHYYHDNSIKKATSSLYNDDGKTVEAFKKGKYEILNFASKNKKNRLLFSFKSDFGKNYQSKTKKITFIIHHFTKKPKFIKINSKKIPFSWNKNKKTVHILLNYKNQLNINIKK